MPFCTKCGAEVPQNIKFCPKCGNAQQNEQNTTPNNEDKPSPADNGSFCEAVKKLALTFTALLALFAGDAMAQCSGKKVYVELPDDWGSNLYISWAGAFPAMTTTKEGSFTVFTFSGLSNDNASSTFAFLNKASNYEASGIMSITRASSTAATLSSGPNAPITNLFSCSNFGQTTYISLVPGSTSQMTISNDPPSTRYFYFLPPNDPEWILNTPILWNGTTQIRMEVDPKRCGWYRVVYFTTQPTDNPAIIVQTPGDATNPNSTNKIGALGMAEDPADWVNGLPTPILLKSRFDAEYGEGKGGDLFFVADGAKMGWSKTDPIIEEKNRCSYSFAAIIYDTDMTVNKSFTSLNDDIGCGSDQYSLWTSGIITGMVKPNLNPETRKIECANCAKGGTVASSQGYFLTEQDFKNAFDPNSNTNVVVCYDMPFARSSDGLWEFDSDKMLNNQNRTVGGFFPEILQNPATSGGNYGSCSSCGTKHPAESFVNLTDSINPWCFERGFKTKSRTGQTMSSCGDKYGPKACPGNSGGLPGDFSHGDNPASTWGATPTGGANWNSDWRYNQINMWGGTNTGKDATANSLFCSESHAEFTYEPGQEFFFRGDDDIWVYMNNKLVVDLGGTHLAAPGYVNLQEQASALGLEEGEKYPIDIFFCNRRTGMSNIRIAANFYFGQGFAQETGLSLATRDPEVKGDVCLNSSGGGSCADVAGGGGTSTKCGTEITANLKYYLTNRARTEGDDLAGIGVPGTKGVLLDINNENCQAAVDEEGDSHILCYGGIKIYEIQGKVQVTIEDILPILAGTWQVWVTHNEGQHPTMKIAEFSISDGEVPIISKTPPMLRFQEPVYYNLKGEPLGKQKPKRAGIYIVRQSGVNKMVVVK